ncbi:MAG: ABC transporter permease [Deltaproteobacteria bacterium]
MIPDRLQSTFQRRLKSWESLLLVVAVIIFVINAFASPYFLNAWNLSDATYNFTEKAMIAFAMALLIIAGEIDLSVAAIIALASTAMGAAAQLGYGPASLVVIGLMVGVACGAVNAVLVTGMGLPSIVVTIGTMSLFRGISYIVLGDTSYGNYPAGFEFFGQGYVYWVFSFEFVLFIVLAIIFAVLLHMTNFGRAVYAIGNNATGALFSGIRVNRVKFILFLLTGLMSGVASVCLTSRLGSTRPSIGTGMELEVVTMVVLGGVNILGGWGTIPGVVIAAFVMGLLTFGLGLLNIPGIVMSIVIGALLIGVIALPRLWAMRRS